ncbi:MAG: winged helix-turn-helix domain-containing protein [Hyphomicrobiaceae bacterium]
MQAWHAVEICALLANETRFAIVSQLAQVPGEGMSLTRLSRRVGVARSTARRQAERLVEAGLLYRRQQGRASFWYVEEARLGEFCDFVCRRLSTTDTGSAKSSDNADANSQARREFDHYGSLSAKLKAVNGQASLPRTGDFTQEPAPREHTCSLALPARRRAGPIRSSRKSKRLTEILADLPPLG